MSAVPRWPMPPTDERDPRLPSWPPPGLLPWDTANDGDEDVALTPVWLSEAEFHRMVQDLDSRIFETADDSVVPASQLGPVDSLEGEPSH